MTCWDVYESPLGPLTVQASPRGLTAVSFPGRPAPLEEGVRDPVALRPVSAQLEAYFAGERHAFDLPLDLAGTPFQRRVWQGLQQVPYGTTVSYTQLAHRVGRPDVVRGVAAAVGRTPVPIVIPCHRVVAADGALTGYGGGLHRKRALLELEGARPASGADRQLALL